MTRSPLLLAGLLGLLLAPTLAAAAFASHRGQEPVYLVAQVHAGLADHPQAWVGRTVRVRGIAISSSTGCETWPSPESRSCRPWQGIVDFVGVSLLPVAAGAPDPLLAALRRLPLAGRLLPPAQYLRWGARASYRVRLQLAAAGSCDQPPCYDAVLLDAAPGSP